MKRITGRWPDFMIIGAARAGTTTLYTHLCRHPQVFMCDPKEPFFFSHESARARGEVWYKSLFTKCTKNQICGEASTSYASWPQCGDVAGGIAQAIPNVKLIYIMRHPVDRAYSHYDYFFHMNFSHMMEKKMSFEEALECDKRFVNESMYMMQIKQYLRYFSRESLLPLLLDDLATNPSKTVSKVWQFLGITACPLEDSSCTANTGEEHYIRLQTTQRLRTIPGMSQVADVLPRSWREGAFRLIRLSPVGRYIAKRDKLRPMRPETRQRLLRLFKQSNHELAAFLNRDLASWFD